jgi:hypothetical protein
MRTRAHKQCCGLFGHHHNPSSHKQTRPQWARLPDQEEVQVLYIMPAAFISAIELRKQRRAEAAVQPQIEAMDEAMLARFLLDRASAEARTGFQDGR